MGSTFDAEWVSKGAHVTCVTRRELSDEEARIPTSRRSQTRAFPTLTDLQTGKVQGRVDASDITMFITTGTQGLQFAAVGGRVLQLAKQKGLGAALPTEWLLQDIRD